MFNLERIYPLSPVEASKSQVNIGSDKYYGSEEILGPKILLSLSTFESKEIEGPKNSWPKMNFESEKYFTKQFVSEKKCLDINFEEKKCDIKNNYGAKKMLG